MTGPALCASLAPAQPGLHRRRRRHAGARHRRQHRDLQRRATACCSGRRRSRDLGRLVVVWETDREQRHHARAGVRARFCRLCDTQPKQFEPSRGLDAPDEVESDATGRRSGAARRAARSAPDFLPMLGITPDRSDGRFTADEDRAGGPRGRDHQRVALEGMVRAAIRPSSARRCGLNESTYTIVGVMSRSG